MRIFTDLRLWIPALDNMLNVYSFPINMSKTFFSRMNNPTTFLCTVTMLFCLSCDVICELKGRSYMDVDEGPIKEDLGDVIWSIL